METAAATHVGMKRGNNEDMMVVREDLGLFAVADGMGGHDDGEVASKLVLEQVAALLSNKTDLSAADRLLTAVELAGNALFTANQAKADSNMGTTFVGMLVQGQKVWVAHAGDSRAYRYSQGELKQLTEDHSLLAEALRRGTIQPEEAERFPYKNVVTRCLGQKANVKPDVQEVQADPGDIFLLCSDGLTGMVSESEINNVLTKSQSLERASQQLIDWANAMGGTDNVTCVLVRIDG